MTKNKKRVLFPQGRLALLCAAVLEADGWPLYLPILINGTRYEPRGGLPACAAVETAQTNRVDFVGSPPLLAPESVVILANTLAIGSFTLHQGFYQHPDGPGR